VPNKCLMVDGEVAGPNSAMGGVFRKEKIRRGCTASGSTAGYHTYTHIRGQTTSVYTKNIG